MRRFLVGHESSRFFSVVGVVSILGIALGVLSLVVTLSVVNGFEGELMKAITAVHGDLIVYTRGSPIQKTAAFSERLRRIAPSIDAVTPSFVFELIASGRDSMQGAVVEGVDFLSSTNVTRLHERVTIGRLPASKNEVMIGKTLSQIIGANVGDTIRLTIPNLEVSNQALPLFSEVKVVGIVLVGMHQYDSKFIYANLEFIQDLLKQPDRATTFKIKNNEKVTPLSDVVTQLQSGLGGDPYRVKSWMQLNANLFYAIRLEKVVIGIILTVIIIVAAFNVVSTLLMLVHEKNKEISILRVLGLSAGQLFQIFNWVGIFIGFIGTILGVGTGLVIDEILQKTEWIKLPPEVYYIGFLPVSINPLELIWISFLSMVICLIACLYPALQVFRKKIIEGLRYE